MSSERWEQTKQILEDVLRLPPEQRQAYLTSACGEDGELRVEVESLIASYEEAGSHFLSAPAPEILQITSSNQPAPLPLDRFIGAIGNYRLVEEIGQGGMGQVWLAEQTAPVRRQVALKLLKFGMYDDAVLKRFHAERQSLALMDHPSIAKVFDAGATPDGQPYLVMEYVPGMPITDYCDQKRLKIRDRLELMVRVCEAVQHAHQKAIIHRDLKPPNILVQEVDGRPVPKIIDFGLAKATSPRMAGDSLYTQVGSFVGTPGYMSPEQCDPSAQDVDTRTDVYSLGVVLYVLLTGCLPFETRKEQPLDETLRQLREDDPPRPSTKVSTHRETSSATATARSTAPKQLVSLLRGDLDWVTMKALEKDRSQRYGTPSELAADLSRYMRNEPVMACPASAGYRLRKYVRRHRIGVATAALIAALLLAFGIAQAAQLRRITRERDRAGRITDFMAHMFKVSDPSEAHGNSITAREILDQASQQIDIGLAQDPEAQAQMMNVMGNVYFSLGLYPRAELLLAHAADIRRRVLGPEHPDTLLSRSDLGATLYEEGHYAEAEKLHREVLAIQRRVLGPEHPDTLTSMNRLANALDQENRFAEEEKLRRETVEGRRRVLGAEHTDTLGSMDNLAFNLMAQSHFADAEKIQRDALEIERRVQGPEHPYTLASINRLARILSLEGHFSEAEQIQRDGLAVQRRVLGAEHPHTLRSMHNLVDILYRENRYPEAEQTDREIREIQQRILPPDSLDTARSTYDMACLEALQGHRNQALPLLREAVDHGLGPNEMLALQNDDDLKSLRGDPRFTALVAHARERAAAAQQKK